jgi:hypothetical protein
VAFKIPKLKIPVSPAALVGGLVAVVCMVGFVFYVQRGAHIELKGSILKVRTQPMDENSSVAVVDFRFVNPSNYPFVVHEVNVSIIDKDGKTVDGTQVSELDARRLFEYYPVLGQKFNDSLIMRDKIPGRASMDRMIVSRFEVPESTLENRKTLKVRIVDVDGPESELQETKR